MKGRGEKGFKGVMTRGENVDDSNEGKITTEQVTARGGNMVEGQRTMHRLAQLHTHASLSWTCYQPQSSAGQHFNCRLYFAGGLVHQEEA
ncbi:hypothetical protein FOPE_04112 [Fonsecaea pedrosoi]|nr:hypothetical protein FOPE_04112 [Fonsecaea pedrosoi]